MKHLFVTLAVILALLPVFNLAAESASKEDRVEIRGGAVLTGIIENSTAEVLILKTAYAGLLQVEVGQIERISSARELKGLVPDGIPLVDLSKPVAVTVPVAKPAPPKKPSQPAKKKEGWSMEAGMNLNGKSGNTEKLDLSVTMDARFLQKFYRLDLYGRYTYGTNRNKLSSDEVVLGGRYTNFFFKEFGFFVREELEQDEFEGLNFRSTSAAGLSWKIKSEKDLNLEARAGFSYRYDDKDLDGYADYPGADIGLDVLWKFTDWAEFKGSYTILPTFESIEDYILEQDSGVNMTLDYFNRWSIRFGIFTKYDNHPNLGKDHLDVRYYARIISSWQ